MNRTRSIKPTTLKYLQSALEFFKKKYGLDSVTCEIEFALYRDGLYSKHFDLLGSYDILRDKIIIEGCDYRSRNQLVKTLFHELTHYWQAKIAKKLRTVFELGNQQVDTEFSDQSLIRDLYHAYPMGQKVYYDTMRTDDIFYYHKPQEIEARKVADELFEEWNLPEHKGKNVR